MIMFVQHIKFSEVENLGWTCFSDDLMVSVEVNDFITFNACLLTIFFLQMWLNDKMLGPRTSQQTYFLLHSRQTARGKTLSAVLHPLPRRQRGSNWSHQSSFWRWVWASTCCPHNLFLMNKVGFSSSFHRICHCLKCYTYKMGTAKIYLLMNL